MSQYKLSSSRSQILLLIIYLLPVALLLWFVASFGVNVPYWDQWAIVGIFEKTSNLQTLFGQLFYQNNEHRIVFPKLIFMTLGFISKWDIRYELYFSVFLAGVIFLSIYKISSSQAAENKSGFHLTNIITALLVFSLVQWENWLWGFQLAWFLVNACITATIAVLYSFPKWNAIARLAIAGVICFIASFSLAQGLLSWLVVIPLIIYLEGSFRQKITRLSVWLLIFIGTCGTYAINYQKLEHAPDRLLFLKRPSLVGNYFLSLLGSPLSQGFSDRIYAGSVAGLIILITIGFFATLYFRKNINSNFKSDLLPWLSLSLFALAFSFLTTLGRAGYGVEQSLSPRYTTPLILLIISLVQMVRLLSYYDRDKNGYTANVSLFMAGILTSLTIVNSANAVVTGKIVRSERQYGKVCLELINYIKESPDNCLQVLFKDQEKAIRNGVAALNRLDFRDFPTNVKFVTQPKKVHGYIDAPTTTQTAKIVRQSESVKVSGWAILPKRAEQPKIVLFSYGNEKTFFASTPISLDSPDVAKVLKSRRYMHSRWRTELTAKFLPPGETAIEAWVYNPDEKQFVKLVGEPKLKVVVE